MNVTLIVKRTSIAIAGAVVAAALAAGAMTAAAAASRTMGEPHDTGSASASMLFR